MLRPVEQQLPLLLYLDFLFGDGQHVLEQRGQIPHTLLRPTLRLVQKSDDPPIAGWDLAC
jgi:hypothetical protein